MILWWDHVFGDQCVIPHLWWECSHVLQSSVFPEGELGIIFTLLFLLWELKYTTERYERKTSVEVLQCTIILINIPQIRPDEPASTATHLPEPDSPNKWYPSSNAPEWYIYPNHESRTSIHQILILHRPTPTPIWREQLLHPSRTIS